MFEMFPGDYGRSQTTFMGMRAGLELGEAYRAAERIKADPDIGPAPWVREWRRLAEQHVDLAEDELAGGFSGSAGDRLLRAAVAIYLAQTRLADRSQRRELLDQHWSLYNRGSELARFDYERVDVPSEYGVLHGLFMPAEADGAAPCVIFYPGFDLDKEMIALTLRDSFRRRGLGVLVLDGPGIGETLWVEGVPTDAAYEKPTAAAIEYLKSRPDTDGENVGVAGVSLGGYYATRAAACEPRLKCCAAWGGILHFGELMRQSHVSGRMDSAPTMANQLTAVMGTDSLDEALERVQALNVGPVLHQLSQPFLLLHGELDRQTPLVDAKKVFRAVSSTDKLLRVYTANEGGAEHCQVDEPRASRELLTDWCSMKLNGGAPAQAGSRLTKRGGQ